MTQKEYEQYIFANVFILNNKLQLAGDKVLKDISIKQWYLLMIISKNEKEDYSLTSIAQSFGSTRQNVTKMIEILEEKGYVSTKKHGSDKRSMTVVVTPKAQEFIEEFEKRSAEFLELVFNDINEVRLKIVYSVFEKLHENIEKNKL